MAAHAHLKNEFTEDEKYLSLMSWLSCEHGNNWNTLASQFFSRYVHATSNGPRQANLVLIAYASSEGSGEPARPRSLARTFTARSYKQWIKRNLQTESQIPGPSEWLGMRSWNLSWRNARRHKFAWRGSNNLYTIRLWFSFTKVIPASFEYEPRQANLCLRAFRHDKF